MRTLLLAVSLSLCAHASIAQPQAKSAKQAVAEKQAIPDDLEFTGFAKPRELLDDPYEFASAEARTLWEHVVRWSQGTSESFGSLLKEGGEYAPVGDGCFLVQYAAIQFTCLGSRTVRDLTPWNPPGNTEILATRALQGGGWWALVSTGKLSHGIVSASYHALVAVSRAGTTSVTSAPLVSSESDDSEDENPCSGGRGAAVQVASKILSHEVQGGPDGDEVLFRILRSDCRTGRTERLARRYRIEGSEVRLVR